MLVSRIVSLPPCTFVVNLQSVGCPEAFHLRGLDAPLPPELRELRDSNGTALGLCLLWPILLTPSPQHATSKQSLHPGHVRHWARPPRSGEEEGSRQHRVDLRSLASLGTSSLRQARHFPASRPWGRADLVAEAHRDGDG